MSVPLPDRAATTDPAAAAEPASERMMCRRSGCGQEFTPRDAREAGGSRRKFCSEECRKLDWEMRHPRLVSDEPAPRICARPFCGRPLPPRTHLHGGPPRRFCSDTCRVLDWRARHPRAPRVDAAEPRP